MDMIERNSEKWIKGLYINLEFPIETVWQNKWLWFHGKDKKDLSKEWTLTEYEKKDMERYVNENLTKFKSYSSPQGIELEKLEQIIEVSAMEGYQLFVVDTFSRIKWNTQENARGNQNRCMEELQELAQKLNVAIVLLHHTNRQGTWEWTQKIMDLSNVFIVITKENDGIPWSQEYRRYELRKDKFVVNKSLDIYYINWKYVKDWLSAREEQALGLKPF